MDKVWPGYITPGGRTSGQFFSLDDFDDFMLYLGRFEPGQRVEFIMRPERKATTLPQNRYYWGVPIKLISEYTGHSPEEIHSMMKWKFLKCVDDKGLEYVPSVMDLSTTEREEYHTKIRMWAVTVLDLNIPEPNEVDIKETNHAA